MDAKTQTMVLDLWQRIDKAAEQCHPNVWRAWQQATTSEIDSERKHRASALFGARRLKVPTALFGKMFVVQFFAQPEPITADALIHLRTGCWLAWAVYEMLLSSKKVPLITRAEARTVLAIDYAEEVA